MGNNKPNFGNQLKIERRKAGYKTQQDFAYAINKSLDTVQNWEQGKTLPTMGDFLWLCDFFQCDADHLLGRIQEKTHDLKFIHDVTGLSEGAIEDIKRMKTVKTSEDFTRICGTPDVIMTIINLFIESGFFYSVIMNLVDSYRLHFLVDCSGMLHSDFVELTKEAWKHGYVLFTGHESSEYFGQRASFLLHRFVNQTLREYAEARKEEFAHGDD